MKYETHLRDEILTTTHRWPIIFLFGLIGSLVGLAIAFILPSPYRATKELYIGIEVQTALSDADAMHYSGINFSSINDFKNWQMANLNTMITLQPVLEETLNLLREKDEYWQEVSWIELEGMLHVYWRNAGKWHLVAETSEAMRAIQAVTAWEEIVMLTAHHAIDAGQQALLYYKELNALIALQNEVQMRLNQLENLQATLSAWQENLSTLAESLPLSETDRLSIWNLILSLRDNNLWERQMATFPQSGSPASDYLHWIEEFTPALGAEVSSVRSQLETLNKRRRELEKAYTEASRQSLGLSPGLRIEKTGDQPAQVRMVRPIGGLLLIGSILGLLTYMFLWMIQINFR